MITRERIITPKKLSRRALDSIQKHPELWEQESWHIKKDCGTCHCYAGWIDYHLAILNPSLSPACAVKNLDEDLLEGEEECTSFEIQDWLDLDIPEYSSITDCQNSFSRLVSLHNLYFEDNYQPTVNVDQIKAQEES